MRAVFIDSENGGSQNTRQRCRELGPADKIVGRKFGSVAKLLWPVKTAATVAAIAKRSERTAERWLAGEFEPPAIVLAAVLVELTRPQ